MTTPVSALMVASLAALSFTNGPSGPMPPCGAPPVPAYGLASAEPSIRHWSQADVPKGWKFPSCVPWTTNGFASMVTIAGRFRQAGGADSLIQRIAQISRLKGVRYWSRTHGEWRTFIEDASALSAANKTARRTDFLPQEITNGATVYFLQKDNTAGDVVYGMHVYESSPNRVVVGMENVGAVKKFFKTILHPTDAQTLFFFDRESADVWSMYSIVRISDNASSLATGNPGSEINRAVALYRHFAGIPTDKDPPASR